VEIIKKNKHSRLFKPLMIRIPGFQLHARTSAAWLYETTLALALGAVALVLARGDPVAEPTLATIG
jgi:hypothetical protein